MKKLGIVLGADGAKAAAQIGFLQVLYDNAIKIDWRRYGRWHDTGADVGCVEKNKGLSYPHLRAQSFQIRPF